MHVSYYLPEGMAFDLTKYSDLSCVGLLALQCALCWRLLLATCITPRHLCSKEYTMLACGLCMLHQLCACSMIHICDHRVTAMGSVHLHRLLLSTTCSSRIAL